MVKLARLSLKIGFKSPPINFNDGGRKAYGFPNKCNGFRGLCCSRNRIATGDSYLKIWNDLAWLDKDRTGSRIANADNGIYNEDWIPYLEAYGWKFKANLFAPYKHFKAKHKKYFMKWIHTRGTLSLYYEFIYKVYKLMEEVTQPNVDNMVTLSKNNSETYFIEIERHVFIN